MAWNYPKDVKAGDRLSEKWLNGIKYAVSRLERLINQTRIRSGSWYSISQGVGGTTLMLNASLGGGPKVAGGSSIAWPFQVSAVVGEDQKIIITVSRNGGTIRDTLGKSVDLPDWRNGENEKIIEQAASVGNDIYVSLEYDWTMTEGVETANVNAGTGEDSAKEIISASESMEYPGGYGKSRCVIAVIKVEQEGENIKLLIQQKVFFSVRLVWVNTLPENSESYSDENVGQRAVPDVGHAKEPGGGRA